MANEKRQDMMDRSENKAEEERKEVLRGVDELFASARAYASSAQYKALMEFTGRFKQFAPYNAMLIYLQRPGADFVLSPRDWMEKFGRVVMTDRRPILILSPNGPLRCLFDVEDTQEMPGGGGDKFPSELRRPYDGDCSRPVSKERLQALKAALSYLGICHGTMQTGAGYAGKLEIGGKGDPDVVIPLGNSAEIRWRPAYSIRVTESANETTQFCSIIHELGHLFCRHLPDCYDQRKPWRVRWLPHETEEFEAESVSWLVARRLGVENPSERFLAEYVGHYPTIPEGTSLEAILKAVTLVEHILASPSVALEYFRKHCPAFKQAMDVLLADKSGLGG